MRRSVLRWALLLVFALRCAEGGSLITPLFSWSVVNTTQNWTASVPVTWSLLTSDNSRRVVGTEAGYDIVWITSQFIEIQSGLKGGVFHLRALRNSCGVDGSGAACVQTATWVVLTDGQFTALGLLAFGLLVGSVLLCISRLKPAPETEEEKKRRLMGSGVVDSGVYGVFDAGSGEAVPLLETRPRRPNTAKRVPGTSGADTL